MSTTYASFYMAWLQIPSAYKGKLGSMNSWKLGGTSSMQWNTMAVWMAVERSLLLWHSHSEMGGLSWYSHLEMGALIPTGLKLPFCLCKTGWVHVGFLMECVWGPREGDCTPMIPSLQRYKQGVTRSQSAWTHKETRQESKEVGREENMDRREEGKE